MRTQKCLLIFSFITLFMFTASVQAFSQVGGAGGTRDSYTSTSTQQTLRFKPSDLLLPVPTEEKFTSVKLKKNNVVTRKRKKS